MDHNMNDFPDSETLFSFEQLLYGDDWQMWDTYPTIDVNGNLLPSMVEMNHGGRTIEPHPISVLYPTVDVNVNLQSSMVEMNHGGLTIEPHPISVEETEEQWFQRLLASELVEIPSYGEVHFTFEVGDVRTGLDVDVIDGNLNRRRYEDRSGEAEKCVICLDELKYKDDASKLACGHDFHFECIKSWIMVKNECPLCKQKAL